MAVKQSSRGNKEEILIEAGRELMFRHGIRRVSIEEICRVAKVSKVTFYRIFPNKLDLAARIIQDTMNASIKHFSNIIDSDRSAEEIVTTIVREKKKLANQMCPELVQEMYDPDFGLKDLLDELTQKGMAEFQRFIVHRQNTGEIRASLDPEFVYMMILKMQELVADEAFVALFSSTGEMTAEVNNFLFYGIMNDPQKRAAAPSRKPQTRPKRK